MPKITIDEKDYEVADGLMILQAIDDLGLLMSGVDIPHYCWHPKLPIDGSCRMCQIEIEGVPKLQIACNTPVKDGMVISTQSERVQTARQGVLELLLLNHPLDCPICDQAGECKLQDYSFDFGMPAGRTKEPRRVAKKAVDLGPTITFDQERCILCRRCVRFCREVPGTGELGVFNRGERSLMELFPGTQLDNDYSMNVADLCPVGALTTKDFRFKIRSWFLDDVETVCDRCSTGCNVYASRSNNKIYRFVPRRNDDVNDTWMCDHGRLSYKMGRENRLESALVGGKPASFIEGLRKASDLVRAASESGGTIVASASPFSSNEDLFTLRKLLETLGAPPSTFSVPAGEADGILTQAEKAPNAEGARALGFQESDELAGAKLGIVFGHVLPATALTQVEKWILIDTHASDLSGKAAVVLPSRVVTEKDGSFTNHAKRVQRFRRVVEPSWEAWSEGALLQQIADFAGLEGWSEPWDAFAVSKRLCDEVPAFSGCGLTELGSCGCELSK